MTSSKQNIVSISLAAEKKIFSKAQKLFNSLIKKIDVEKKLLLEWQEAIPVFQRKIIDEYEVLWGVYNAQRVEIVYILDSVYGNKIFKRNDKQKIRHIICEITADLITDHGKEELKGLHDKHSDYHFDAIRQESDDMASEFIKSMMQGMNGIDIGDDIDISTPEKFETLLHEKLKGINDHDAEKTNPAGDYGVYRKKTDQQVKREVRRQQEEQSISQSIREVYRKLISALHPDREQDAVERQRKTAIMQRVNTAYAKKDLLGLLELQLEVEQIDQSYLNNIAEDRLKSFNKILKEQLLELQQEITEIQYLFKSQLKLGSHALLTPKFLLQQLQHDIRDMEKDIAHLKQEQKIFRNPNALKIWLKTYILPKQPKVEDPDDLIFEQFMPPY